MKKETVLTVAILAGLVLGCLVGQFLVFDKQLNQQLASMVTDRAGLEAELALVESALAEPSGPVIMDDGVREQLALAGRSNDWYQDLVARARVLEGQLGDGEALEALQAERRDARSAEAGELRAQIKERTGWMHTAGQLLFIRPLMLMIIPLVFISVVVGVCAIGDPQKLGLVGGATVVYYLATMVLAITVGLLLVNIVRPGAGGDESMRTELRSAGEAVFEAGDIATSTVGPAEALTQALVGLVEQMVPRNIIGAAAAGNTLAIVMAGILIGMALVMSGEVAKPAIELFNALFQALMKVVIWIIWLAPLGVFFLVAARVGEVGLSDLVEKTGKYALTVVLGLLVHGLVTLPLLLWLIGRVHPYKYLAAVRKVILVAFSTASSSATLPITIEETQRQGGASKRAANFVLPLGATVNMDGTALYQGVAVVFLFQLYDIPMSIGDQLIIVVTATLAAVGAAAIPSAGLVTMAIVIAAVNSSLVARGGENALQLPASAIGVILGVDRILDMCRTCVNVWGDCVGARLITRLAPDEEEEREKALA